MKPEVLIVGPLMERVESALDDLFVTHRLYQAGERDAFLAEIGPRVRGVATTGFDGADAAMIDAMPNLEIISCYGVGVDAIDIPHAIPTDSSMMASTISRVGGNSMTSCMVRLVMAQTAERDELRIAFSHT